MAILSYLASMPRRIRTAAHERSGMARDRKQPRILQRYLISILEGRPITRSFRVQFRCVMEIMRLRRAPEMVLAPCAGYEEWDVHRTAAGVEAEPNRRRRPIRHCGYSAVATEPAHVRESSGVGRAMGVTGPQPESRGDLERLGYWAHKRCFVHGGKNRAHLARSCTARGACPQATNSRSGLRQRAPVRSDS